MLAVCDGKSRIERWLIYLDRGRGEFAQESWLNWVDSSSAAKLSAMTVKFPLSGDQSHYLIRAQPGALATLRLPPSQVPND